MGEERSEKQATVRFSHKFMHPHFSLTTTAREAVSSLNRRILGSFHSPSPSSFNHACAEGIAKKRNGDGKLPPAIPEPGLPPMAPARWRAHTSKWVPEPHTVGSLVLSLLKCSGDSFRELRTIPPPTQDGLPMNTHQSRRLAKRTTLAKKAQYEFSVPIRRHDHLIP